MKTRNGKIRMRSSIVLKQNISIVYFKNYCTSWMILFVMRRLALENKIWANKLALPRFNSNSIKGSKENFLPLSRANEGKTSPITRKQLSSVRTSPDEIPKDGIPNAKDRISLGNSLPMVIDTIPKVRSS